MDGEPCPIHKKPMWLLSTWNQWKYYCKECDARYNKYMEKMGTGPDYYKDE